MPGSTVVVPCDASSTRSLTESVAETRGPVYMRLDRNALLPVHSGGEPLSVGKGSTLETNQQESESVARNSYIGDMISVDSADISCIHFID